MIVTGVEVVTALVLIVNDALVAPAPTVTDAGTDATAELLLLKLTTTPPDDAEALRFTVPFALFPPTTLDGLTLSDDSRTAVVYVAALDILFCIDGFPTAFTYRVCELPDSRLTVFRSSECVPG